MEVCILERVEKIKEFLEEKKEILLRERLKKIEILLKEEIKNGSCRLQKELLRLVADKEEGYLVFSFLRSSYLIGSHKFLLLFYIEEPFLEENPDSIFIDLQLFFAPVKEDLQEINKEIEKEFVQIFAAEKEEIRRWYMDSLYQKFGRSVFSVLGSQEGGIEVYYGGFMEELYLAGRI